MSVSLAFAAYWEDDKSVEGYQKAKPIFSKPGEYTLKCGYPPKPGEQKYIEQVLEVTVPEPRGEDRAVYDLLRKDPLLAGCLMKPVDVPPIEVLPRLRDLLKRFPKSSYTPYARLALSRRHWGGTGINYRLDRALAAIELDQILLEQQDPKNRWAYHPYALILLRRLDLEAKESFTIDLNNEHADAIEWLEEIAPALKPHQWQAFRKRVPQLPVRPKELFHVNPPPPPRLTNPAMGPTSPLPPRGPEKRQ